MVSSNSIHLHLSPIHDAFLEGLDRAIVHIKNRNGIRGTSWYLATTVYAFLRLKNDLFLWYLRSLKCWFPLKNKEDLVEQ